MQTRVVVTVSPYSLNADQLVKRLLDEGFAVQWEPGLANSNDTAKIIALTKGCHYVIAGGERWSREAIEANKHTLRMITRLGAGYDKVDLTAASEAGIAVANTPGVNSATIAEHAIALMMSVLRGIPAYDRKIRENQWTTALLNQVYGKTVGLVGFGAIAKQVSRMLKGFSTTLLAYDVMQNRREAEELGVAFVSLDELLEQSDIVSLHVPLTPESKGMVNLGFLAKMKPSAIIINTSRGKIIKESDLIEALERNMIAGAGLDVFEEQPLPASSPLCKMDNVVMSSHIGGMSPQSYTAMFDGCVQNILDHHSGKEVVHLLNPAYSQFLHGRVQT